jgi:hypothetical protein
MKKVISFVSCILFKTRHHPRFQNSTLHVTHKLTQLLYCWLLMTGNWRYHDDNRLGSQSAVHGRSVMMSCYFRIECS